MQTTKVTNQEIGAPKERLMDLLDVTLDKVSLVRKGKVIGDINNYKAIANQKATLHFDVSLKLVEKENDMRNLTDKLIDLELKFSDAFAEQAKLTARIQRLYKSLETTITELKT